MAKVKSHDSLATLSTHLMAPLVLKSALYNVTVLQSAETFHVLVSFAVCNEVVSVLLFPWSIGKQPVPRSKALTSQLASKLKQLQTAVLLFLERLYCPVWVSIYVWLIKDQGKFISTNSSFWAQSSFKYGNNYEIMLLELALEFCTCVLWCHKIQSIPIRLVSSLH